MSTKAEQMLESCTQDLNRAVWLVIQQRMDWAALSEKEREKIHAEMDRAARCVLTAAMERVIASVAMFARLEAARGRDEGKEAEDAAR